MRRIAWGLLLLFAFAIPWEYSLELGEPLGNIARLVGLFVLLAAIPAVLASGRLRTPGPMLWLTLALYLWLCCSYFWTIAPLATLDKLRGYFQEMMILWLVWEFAGDARDLRTLLRVFVAGSWVLALLTMANFATTQAVAEQIRFVAAGQDPNGYLPLGLVAVLLTASRGGFVAAVVALAGSSLLLAHGHPRRVLAGVLALPPAAFMLWLMIPRGTFERLATVSELLHGGDLNRRLNIWEAGWHAFARAPFFGTGAGSFVAAAGLAPVDTAHNTALSIAVAGGLCALFLASLIVAAAIWSIAQTRGPLKWAMAVSLAVWVTTSLVATVEESRTTWLLLALIALAGRLSVEEPEELAACFPDSAPLREFAAATEPIL